MPRTTAQLKEDNLHALKTALKRLSVASKGELSAETGLSPASCNTLINELARSGEILCLPARRANEMGRPTRLYQINEEFQKVLCLFPERLEARPFLHAVVYNLAGSLTAEEKTVWESESLETLFQFTDKLLAAHPQIGAIGISVQGVVKKDGKIVACDAKPLAGLNLKAKLQERFHLPVVCENDMNLVAYGLMLKKALGREASIAVLAKYSAVPSGAGLIVDGHFLRGSTDFAGEVSFLPTPDSSPFSLTLYQLLSLITVANPACIALTGDQVTEDAVAQLQKQIRRFIPAEHCPRLTLLKTPFLYARQGLFALCLKELEHE